MDAILERSAWSGVEGVLKTGGRVNTRYQTCYLVSNCSIGDCYEAILQVTLSATRERPLHRLTA